MTYSSKPFAAVCSFDDAIDEPVGPEAAKYGAYRDDASLQALKLREGEVPETYWCRRLLTSEEREVALAGPNEEELYCAAFARGLVRVEQKRWDDGSRRDWHRPNDKKPLTDNELAEFFDRATRVEIGMVIYGRSFLARQRGLTYRLPHTCALAVGASLVRRVERMRAIVDSLATKPPAEAPLQEPPTSSPDGVGSTPATATASAT